MLDRRHLKASYSHPDENVETNKLGGFVTDDELYVLDSVGVLIARRALEPDRVAHINRRLDEKLKGATVKKFPILDLGETFMDLMSHPWIVGACSRLLGEGFRFDHAFGLEQPAVRENLHGGPFACQGSSFYHAVGGAVSVGRVSVGIALTHQSRETGGFVFIPGSHKSSFAVHGSVVLKELLHQDFGHECLHVPTLNPGDVCLFPDALVHGTTPWVPNGHRRALYYMYSPGYMSWRPYSEIARYTDLATSELQRQLLRPPYVASFMEEGTTLGDNRWRPPSVRGSNTAGRDVE